MMYSDFLESMESKISDCEDSDLEQVYYSAQGSEGDMSSSSSISDELAQELLRESDAECGLSPTLAAPLPVHLSAPTVPSGAQSA